MVGGEHRRSGHPAYHVQQRIVVKSSEPREFSVRKYFPIWHRRRFALVRACVFSKRCRPFTFVGRPMLRCVSCAPHWFTYCSESITAKTIIVIRASVRFHIGTAHLPLIHRGDKVKS